MKNSKEHDQALRHSLAKFRHTLYSFRFEILLASLLIVFMLNILFPLDIHGGLAQSLYLPLQLMAGILLFEKKRYLLWGLLALALGIFVCHVLHFFLIGTLAKQLMLLYIVFFGSVTLELFRQMSHIRAVTMQSVVAAICGLLLIGYCGFYVFLGIETHSPGSFNGLGTGIRVINDLFYFSYITILTIGYGDIVPQSWVARNATVFLGVTAYIYSIVVVAAIVGRLRRATPDIQEHAKLDNRAMRTSDTTPLSEELLRLLEALRYGQDEQSHKRLSDRIRALCKAHESASLHVQCHVAQVPSLTPERSRALYNVACEAIANAGVHAAARHLFVSLAVQGDNIVLSVEDDGMGFDLAQKKHGYGIELIYLYARILEGSVDIAPLKEGGLRMILTAPISTR